MLRCIYNNYDIVKLLLENGVELNKKILTSNWLGTYESYTPLMLKQLAFDNICHEHIYYYSLTSIINLLNKVDMIERKREVGG